jgi:hypothetical protein
MVSKDVSVVEDSKGRKEVCALLRTPSRKFSSDPRTCYGKTESA